MDAFRLLIVEDNDGDLANCRSTLERYMDEHSVEIEIVECKSVDEAFQKIDNSFDGAIIDLRLADQFDGGNQVVDWIEEMRLRIPIAILTGTPGDASVDFPYIGMFKKGDLGAGYDDLMNLFWDIHNTGLTRIMGGRGVIEETLGKVFKENLIPQKDKWVEYGKVNAARTEKALLRHALNHLLQLLDDDGDRSFPEEVYLHPPLTNNIRTGSIVKRKADGSVFVVMNPACDLVIRRNGRCKTDRVLLVKMEREEDVVQAALSGITKSDKRKRMLHSVFGNNFTDYFHWMPKTDFFVGGFLNFRNLTTKTVIEFEQEFETPKIQVSSSYIKDIVARFSSYYARQGQPDINCDVYVKSFFEVSEVD